MSLYTVDFVEGRLEIFFIFTCLYWCYWSIFNANVFNYIAVNDFSPEAFCHFEPDSLIKDLWVLFMGIIILILRVIT